MAETCPLCRHRETQPFTIADGKRYYRCERCEMTFLEPSARLSSGDEFAHYKSHQNNVDDPHYRRFLARLAEPLMARLAPASKGLDYGCGPGPALAQMLREAGHTMAVYDPYFADDRTVFDKVYDFVTCTEVAEHFHDPAMEFVRLDHLIRPGGWLALMTCFQTEDDKFTAWHYRKDPTHVVFYKCKTLAFVADQKCWSFESPAKDVVLMKKPETQ